MSDALGAMDSTGEGDECDFWLLDGPGVSVLHERQRNGCVGDEGPGLDSFPVGCSMDCITRPSRAGSRRR